jgi:hypothetical protein
MRHKKSVWNSDLWLICTEFRTPKSKTLSVGPLMMKSMMLGCVAKPMTAVEIMSFLDEALKKRVEFGLVVDLHRIQDPPQSKTLSIGPLMMKSMMLESRKSRVMLGIVEEK